MALTNIEDALRAIARGSMAAVVDDEDRENEGDLIMAAELATPEALAFMVRHTSGVICVALPAERLAALQLPLMVADNADAMKTAFTITTDYRHGTSTGISAHDRALTIRALVDPAAAAQDFSRPGHIFPLRAAARGVLQRPGPTEAAVDLARLAGLRPGGVLCELVNEDGTMSRRPQLEQFAARHGLPLISIADLIAYRKRTEQLVRRVSTARIPTRHGEFIAHSYETDIDGNEHVALVMGEPDKRGDVLVRLHSECLTGDVFGSLRCDCGAQLDNALARIAREGCGVVVYLRGHEGRGIGLARKLCAYALQDRGRDTVQANLELGLAVDARDYSAGAQILLDLGVASMRLMSNNPSKFSAIASHGLIISKRVPLLTEPTAENRRYLDTKQAKLGHLLELHQAAA
jgi:3,4-dihydroxy 2-butanone 4-phosphate synthase/GTP cyclohydrolase II